MHGRLYTLLIADRSSGVVRRVTFRLGRLFGGLLIAILIPILIGLGARWSASSEIDRLRTANAALAVENGSYREATGELTTQIQSLEGVVNELGARSAFDLNAAQRTPKPQASPSRATGGALPNSALSNVLSTISSPEDMFGILRELLRGLENRLRFARGETGTPSK